MDSPDEIVGPALTAIPPSALRIRVLKNAIVLFGGQAALILASAITTFALARQLGAEQFGQYNAVVAFVSLFLPVASIGLDNLLVREMAQDSARARSILGAGMVLRVATSSIAVVICIGASIYFDYTPRERDLIAIWSLSLILAGGQLFQIPFALVLDNSRPVRVSTAIAFVGTFARILLVIGGAPLQAYFVCNLLVSGVTSLALFQMVRQHPELSPQWNIDRQVTTRLLRGCMPLVLIGILIAAYQRIDQQFLLMWKGAHELGQYAAAVRLAETVSLFPVLFMRSAFPIIASKAGESEAGSLRIASSLYRHLFLINLPVILLGIVFSPLIISFLYGPAYAGAAVPFPWLLAAELFVIAGVVYSQFSLAAKLQKFDVLFTLANFSANLVLCFMLIPRWGSAGAAVAALASYGAGIPLQLVFRATRPYSIVLFREILRMVSVAVLTCLAFLLISRAMPVMFALGFSIVSFTVLSVWTNLLRREDLRAIGDMWASLRRSG